MRTVMVLYEVCGSVKIHIGKDCHLLVIQYHYCVTWFHYLNGAYFPPNVSTDFHHIMSHQLLWFSIKAIQHKWLPLRNMKWTVSRKLWESPIWFHDTISVFHAHTDIDLGMKWWFMKSMKFSQCKCFSKTKTTDQGNDQGKHRTWVTKYSN